MNFRQAVSETNGIRNAWRPGLQALKAGDRPRVTAASTRTLAGSVDLDGALAREHPRENRWDYGIGSKRPGAGSEYVYWVEVHPASDGETATMLRKLSWLRGWLRASESPLNALDQEFVWVSSGRTAASLAAPLRRRLAKEHGLLYVGAHLTIR